MDANRNSQPRLSSKKSTDILKYGYDTRFYSADRNPINYEHYHDYYEVIFYLGNKNLSYLCSGRTYELSRGDIILCSMFEPHRYFCETNLSYDRVSVGIEPGLLLHFSTEDANLAWIFNRRNQSYPIFHTDAFTFSKYMNLLSDYRDLRLQHGQHAVQLAIIHQLLACLYSDCCEESAMDSAEARRIALVSNLVHYIDGHLAEPLSLKTLSEAVNYSVAYICKAFRETTGDTLIQYISKKRVARARQLLTENIPAAEAAERTGFSSYSYFYRTFKKLEGCGPGEFKAQYYKIGNVSDDFED